MSTLPQNDVSKPEKPLSGVRNPDIYNNNDNTEPELSNQFQNSIQSDFGKSVSFLKNVNKPGTIDRMLLSGDMSGEFSGVNLGSWRKDPNVVAGRFTQQDLQDYRAENQSRFWQAVNGFGKMGVTALTTFADSFTVTQAAGIISGSVVNDATNGSQYWDNPVTRAIVNIHNWSERVMPNYYDSEGKGSAMNFIFDKVVKNAGYMLGTVAAGYVAPEFTLPTLLSKGIGKALSLVTKNVMAAKNFSTWTRGYLTGLQSAAVEASVEAINNSKEWYDALKYELDDKLNNGEIGQIEYNNRINKLNEDRIKMGNADYMLNLVLLSISNYVQFGRAFGAGFETQSRLVNILRNGKLYDAVKEMPVVVAKSTKNALMEGFEEANQSLFSIVSGKAAEEDYLRYFDDTKNYKAQHFANTVINNFGKGMSELLHDKQTFEEFAVGAIIGALGIPWMKRVQSVDQNGNVKTQHKFQWQGGIYGEVSDYLNDLKYTQGLITPVNERIQSGEMSKYYRNIMGHLINSDEQNAAIVNKDKWSFKNSEFRDMYHDVAMFSKLGKLEDLKELISEDLGTDDASINDIIKATTTQVETENGVKQKSVGSDENGNPINREKLKSKIEETKQQLFDMIDSYQEIYNNINFQTNGLLSDEALETATWMKMQAEDWSRRAEGMYNESVKDTVSNYLRENLSRLSKKKDLSDSEQTVTEVFNTLLENIDNVNIVGRYLAEDNGLYTRIRDGIIDNESRKTFEDFLKCCRGVYNFNNKLNDYITNPSKLIEDLDEEEARIQNEWYDTLVERGIHGVENGEFSAMDLFTSIKDTASTPDIERALFERLKKKIDESENEELKKEYKRYSEAETNVDDFIKAVATTTKEDISGLRNDLINKYIEAGSLEDFKKIVEGIYNDKELSEEIFHEMEEIKKSASFGKEAGPSKTKSSVEEVKKKKETKQQEEDKDLGDSIPAEGPMPDSVLEELGITKTKAEEIQKVKQEALFQTKTGKKAVVEGDVDTMNPETDAMVPEEDEPQDNDDGANVVTNWFLYENQKYNVASARDIHSKRLNPATPINQKLEEYGAFDFIDNGGLQKLIDKNDKKGIPTKVHYLIHNVKLEDTPFKQDKYRKVVLAVEVETGGVNINGKSYQIVGVLGGKTTDGKLNKYARQQEKSAVEEYNSKKLKRYDSTDPENNAPEWYICADEDNHNYVRKIYTGRFVKSTGEASSATTRSLGDVTIGGERLKNLERPDRKVGMGVVMGKKEHTFKVVSPNDNIQQINNFNALAVLEGSVWLLTQQSDGRMYPRYCYPKTASRFLADLGEDGIKSNNIYKTIEDLCEKICDFNQPLSERIKAKYEIMRYLYMGPAYWVGDDIIFENALHLNGNIVSSKAFGKISIENGKEDAQKLMDALFASSSGLRMQFDYKRFTDEGEKYVREVLKSDILETDLLQVENINSSFDMFDELPKTSDGKEDIVAIKEKISDLKNRVIANPENKYRGDRVTFLGDFYSYRNGEWVNESHPEKVNEYPKEVLDFAANPTSNITYPLSPKRKHSLGYIEVDGNFYPFTISSNREVDFLRTKKGTLYTKQAYNKLVKQIEAENQKIEEEQNEALQQEAMLNEVLENGKTEQISTEEPEAQESAQAQPQSKEEFYEGLKNTTKEPKETSEITNTAPSEIVNAYNDYIKNQAGINNTAKETAVKTLLSDKDMLVSENTSIWSLLLTSPSIKKLNLGTLLDIRNLIVSKISSGSLSKESFSAVLNTKNKQEQLKTLMDILNECK